jgi:hypothetical protein
VVLMEGEALLNDASGARPVGTPQLPLPLLLLLPSRAMVPTWLLPTLLTLPPAAITLFEVFLRILEVNSDPSQPFPSVWGTIPLIIGETLK